MTTLKDIEKEKGEWWEKLDLEKLRKRQNHLIKMAVRRDNESRALENLIDYLRDKKLEK